MFQVGRKWQPYRTASRFVPLESTQNQDSLSLVGPSFKWLSVLSSRVDVRRQPAARRLLVARRAVDDGRPQDRPGDQQRPTRGAFLETDRTRGAGSTAPPTPTSPNSVARNHELKTGYLGWRNMASTENIGYPNQQQYRYRSLTGDLNCDEAHNYDGCFTRPDSVLVYDYPNTTASGEWYNSAYFNDKITLSRKFTLNVGVRYDRYSSFLPEQGNPGTGPFATKNIFAYKGESNYPIYSTLRAARVGRLRRHRRGPRRGRGPATAATSAAAPVRRRIPDPGAERRQPERDHHAHLFELGRRHSVRAESREPDVDVRRRHAAHDRSESQGTVRRRVHRRPRPRPEPRDDAAVQLRAQDRRQRQQDASTSRCPTRPTRATTTGIDPGRDNVTGTADDQPMLVYSVPSTYPDVRPDHRADRPGAKATTAITRFGVTLNKQFSNNYSFLVSFDTDYRDLRDNAPRNPNEAL